MLAITVIQDGDQYDVVRDSDGAILGRIDKWYKRAALNLTGERRFSARLFIRGRLAARHDFPTLPRARDYIVSHFINDSPGDHQPLDSWSGGFADNH